MVVTLGDWCITSAQLSREAGVGGAQQKNQSHWLWLSPWPHGSSLTRGQQGGPTEAP